MNMMNSIAGAAMDISASKLALDYSISVTKKIMDTQELVAQELLTMLPQQSSAKGEFIDVNA